MPELWKLDRSNKRDPLTPYWKSDCGNAVIYLADCLDVLPTLGKIDVVITDPPYGDSETHAKHLSSVTLKDGTPAGRELGFKGISENDMLTMAESWVAKAERWCVFTCEWKFCKRLHDSKLLIRHGIWRKPDGAPQFTGDRPGTGWEAVAICHKPGKKRWNGGGRHAFWTYTKGQNTGHPTGKPLGLFVDFVNDFSDFGETILDPFMGSGTTGVACMKLGRKFIGIEIDEKYCRIAVGRIQRELMEQGKMYKPTMNEVAKSVPVRKVT